MPTLSNGYASGFEELVLFINSLLPKHEHIGLVYRESNPLYSEIAIHELIANALNHQDMAIRGAGFQMKLVVDRLEITNPGESLVQIERMIDLPPRLRNEALAALMRRMNLCEEQGSGLDKVIMSLESFRLPPTKFQAEKSSIQAADPEHPRAGYVPTWV